MHADKRISWKELKAIVSCLKSALRVSTQSIFEISAWSHVKELRYWVKILLVWPSAPALSATFQMNKLVIDRRMDGWTDGQTNSLTPYTEVCWFFLLVKFATSLLPSLAGALLTSCLLISWSWRYPGTGTPPITKIKIWKFKV